MSLRRATVTEILETHTQLQKLRVELSEPEDSGALPLSEKADTALLAYNYLALAQQVQVGEEVLVNTTGIELALGTGGIAFVVPSKPFSESRNYGHIVKLRYAPLQRAFDSVEEQDSPYHALLQEAQSLEGMPVVCCELHSQMPLVAAAVKREAPQVQIAYIMTDTAALPLAFSKLASATMEAGLINHTITCGQAFGGEYEAVNLYSALLSSKLVCKAQMAIVAPGPGVVGTNTRFGHSGIAQGEALNATAALQGNPIAALRLSWQDARVRHQGLSHHSATVLGQVCLASVTAPLPADLSPQQQETLDGQLREHNLTGKHGFPRIDYAFDSIDLRGVRVSTMGRGREDSPEFFSAAFAAGIAAAQALEPPSMQDAQATARQKPFNKTSS